MISVQDAPPKFARESEHHKFSKAFKEIVEACLSKDPSRRPSAVELLDTPFFKSAKRKSYLVNTILSMSTTSSTIIISYILPLLHRGLATAHLSAGEAREGIRLLDGSKPKFNFVLGFYHGAPA